MQTKLKKRRMIATAPEKVERESANSMKEENLTGEVKPPASSTESRKRKTAMRTFIIEIAPLCCIYKLWFPDLMVMPKLDMQEDQSEQLDTALHDPPLNGERDWNASDAEHEQFMWEYMKGILMPLENLMSWSTCTRLPLCAISRFLVQVSYFGRDGRASRCSENSWRVEISEQAVQNCGVVAVIWDREISTAIYFCC